MNYAILRCAALVGILVLGWTGPASADRKGSFFKEIYVFGDSLSDSAGNLFALSGGVEPPSPPYADGRFSNGPVWVEYLAAMLGLSVDADNNRAVGGAFTDTRNSHFFANGTGILSQVAEFEDDGIKIKKKDLVIVWGGANNYIFDPLANPALVVDDVKHAVEELANLGGRRFLVPNLPPLGDIPLGNPLFGILTPEEKAGLNFLSAVHNAELAAVTAELREDLGIQIVVLDIHATVTGLLADPGSFGFVNVSIPCLIQQLDGTRIPTFVCPPDGSGGFIATGTAFWDLVHPTTALHASLAVVARSALGPLEAKAVAHAGE